MPEYICYCSKCYCKTFKTLRTVREHLSTDKQALDLAVQSGSLQGRNHPLQKHIDDTERSIAKAIEAERRASQVHAGVSTIAGDHGTRSQSLSAHGGGTADASMDVAMDDIAGSDGSNAGVSGVEEDSSDYSDDEDNEEQERLDYLDVQLQGSDGGLEEVGEEYGEEGGFEGDDEMFGEPVDKETGTSTLPANSPSASSNSIPTVLRELRESLLGDYECPKVPPHDIHDIRLGFEALTKSQLLSLRHFIIWKKTGGTVKAYELHARLLHSATGIKVLPLHGVRKLARKLTKFIPTKVDMCPRSCIAYTGKYKDLEACPYIIPASKNQERTICGRSRYRELPSGKLVPLAYFQLLSVRRKIEALYANADTARLLRYRNETLKSTLHLLGTALESTRKYSDFPNSQIHCMQHKELKLFQDERDVAIALSTDGAQLTMKKLSNTWILILIFFNFPPELRYKTSNVMVCYAIPGPHSPGDVESFLYPLFEEFAQGSEGFWMWDAVKNACFVNRFWAVLGNGDMLGSAKINGFVGHTGFVGDRFSMVEAAKNKPQGSGAKALYYPSFPPQNELYNPKRAARIDLANIPVRTQVEYYQTIERLNTPGISARAQAKIATETGVLRLPLCAASEAFIHPTFFPLDPFHLFYENIMTFVWDIWTGVHAKDDDPVRLPDQSMKTMGEWIQAAVATLPPAFCGLIRNPYEKRNSQYKIFEWMAILHWYFIPMAIELRLNMRVIQNFAKLVRIIEFAMTPVPRLEAELADVEKLTIEFLEEFERIYVQDKPENISRMRLCIFQLIHVPRHARWNGSLRVGSQATVERLIGEFGRKIASQKAPYANLANIIHEAELIKILCLYRPDLDDPPIPEDALDDTDDPEEHVSISQGQTEKFSQRHSLTIKARQDDSSLLAAELKAITAFVKKNYSVDVDLTARSIADVELSRFGKYRLRNSETLQCRLSGLKASTVRSYRWFEANNPAILDPKARVLPTARIYGEALGFYTVAFAPSGGGSRPPKLHLVTYVPAMKATHTLQCSVQAKWPDNEAQAVQVLECQHIQDVIGIWMSPLRSKVVYMVRKHPGLSFLTDEERGQQIVEDEDETT